MYYVETRENELDHSLLVEIKLSQSMSRSFGSENRSLSLVHLPKTVVGCMPLFSLHFLLDKTTFEQQSCVKCGIIYPIPYPMQHHTKHLNMADPIKNTNDELYSYSLRSKRFRASLSRKLGRDLFLLWLYLSRNNSIGNACYAGYNSQSDLTAKHYGSSLPATLKFPQS